MVEVKVSVIVPIFNVAPYIERCVRSLFEQTLQEVEYIFVDDASPDESVAILKCVMAEYPARAAQSRILVHEVNKGLPAARNTGLAVARGEYVIHCDSDDWVDRKMYQEMYDTAKATNSDYVACDFYMEQSGRKIHFAAIDGSTDKVDIMKRYITYGWTVIWNVLASRMLYEKYGLKAYEGYNFCEDYGLSVRLLYYSQRYSRVEKPLYYYNRNNISSIVSKANNPQNILKNTDSQLYIYDKINNFFIDNNFFVELEKELSWRMLSAKRGWLFLPEKWKDYRDLAPETNRYIGSNPLCSIKDKICQTLIIREWTTPLIYVIKFFDKVIHKYSK